MVVIHVPAASSLAEGPNTTQHFSICIFHAGGQYPCCIVVMLIQQIWTDQHHSDHHYCDPCGDDQGDWQQKSQRLSRWMQQRISCDYCPMQKLQIGLIVPWIKPFAIYVLRNPPWNVWVSPRTLTLSAVLQWIEFLQKYLFTTPFLQYSSGNVICPDDDVMI